MPHDRDALITGIGLVSCLGSGAEATWTALQDFHPVVDAESFPPFLVHPLAPLELDKQIPKRGDQRQMEAWQRMGVFAAGLALESASLKGNADLLGRMDMIVAAGGGERDYAVDAAILSGYPKQPNPGAWLNERLLSDLRPTLFLAQLSNLLAGNISIVHGVTGSSRTFMGEESAGADAIRIACARIAAGQGDLLLVGGSYNAQRPDVLLHYEMGGLLRHAPFAGVWERQRDKPGMILSSVGCFLVIESRRSAAERGVTPFAHVAGIRTDRCKRDPGQATANAQAQLKALGGAPEAVISAASGAPAPTREEAAFLADLGLPVRGVATAIGHSLEPAFPAAMALAALAIRHGSLFPPLEASEAATTSPPVGALKKTLVTGWGHWRGEAMALVETA
jgi:3-oxoacyl-[acyl-carrier-protein] synthase II